MWRGGSVAVAGWGWGEAMAGSIGDGVDGRMGEAAELKGWGTSDVLLTYGVTGFVVNFVCQILVSPSPHHVMGIARFGGLLTAGHDETETETTLLPPPKECGGSLSVRRSAVALAWGRGARGRGAPMWGSGGNAATIPIWAGTGWGWGEEVGPPNMYLGGLGLYLNRACRPRQLRFESPRSRAHRSRAILPQIPSKSTKNR